MSNDIVENTEALVDALTLAKNAMVAAADSNPSTKAAIELAIELRVHRIAARLEANGHTEAAHFVRENCNTTAMPFFA